MTLTIGGAAPDFEADTTQGHSKFHDWLGDLGGCFFLTRQDFTPICTTERGYMARIKPEFDRRGVKVIGLSVDTTRDHERWAKDIEEIRSELSDQSPTRASLSPSFTDVAGEDDRQRQ